MNILAIDFGTKNIGLAWVDTGIGAVLPFGQVKANSSQSTVGSLAELIEKEKIDQVVVGLPLSFGGGENKNTERIRKFAEELKQNVSVPIDFMNEMFSSQGADRMGDGVSRDEKAAMIILEDYLNKIIKRK